MTRQPDCQACAYVIQQLGPGTSCFVHVARCRPAAVHEPYAANPLPRPTLEHPGLFTLREYARLLVVRSRVQEQRWTDLLVRPK